MQPVSNGGANAVEVVIKLAPAAIVKDSREYRAIQDCLAKLGVTLRRLHPSTSDPNLATYAVTHVDPGGVERLVQQLNRCDGVEGAYAKPRGEPPE